LLQWCIGKEEICIGESLPIHPHKMNSAKDRSS